MTKISRLPNTLPLTSIIPKGTEGGKEFSRIIDLLLFQDYRRQGKILNVFSDSSGDFRALDSFESSGNKSKRYIGYQYKYFPSPLSASHRIQIIESLKSAQKKFKKKELRKWVLVTPDDFTESATKQDGGDVTWFENLKTFLNLGFEIEHWGKTKLTGLFIETPSLCLFYYPELTVKGLSHKQNFESIKQSYVSNLIQLHQNIEFVGMSIYKPEETRGIPMEHIYIPLNVVPESSADSSEGDFSTNPHRFLEQGAKTVILGDPGSGKSTLLKFLALSGVSESIANKYQSDLDDRLPIYIILRKYADELKKRTNLSLIDYIIENIQAEFSLVHFDLEFLEYFLETGKAIILFDGLDELPDAHFKKNLRDRIRGLYTTYPGNTLIVTSRIVGYDQPFRFETNEFNHFKVAKLRLPEMEQFVKDWYKIRIENPNDKELNVKDLISILRDENHTAIRELAENPLLLTIITLVHRIDAVLPDQRVVLYHKCTETLLNTWHTSKYKTPSKFKTSVEARNRRRLEAIAHWMHIQSVGVGKTQRSVVPYNDLLNFLVTHIENNERALKPDDDPQDLANEFIEFIKDRAGLLIEVGDQSYSFVHLTFQEYLTATYLMAHSEKNGIIAMEFDLRKYAEDPRWYEVVRLLVASLKSEESQEFIINTILSIADNKHNRPILLGGLLLDSVPAAEVRKHVILEEIVSSALEAKNAENVRNCGVLLKNWINKDVEHADDIDFVYNKLWLSATSKSQKVALALLAHSAGLITKEIQNLQTILTDQDSHDGDDGYKLFFGKENTKEQFSNKTSNEIHKLLGVQKRCAITAPYYNFLAVCMLNVFLSYDEEYAAQVRFNQLMMTLGTGLEYGPFTEFVFNLTLMIEGDQLHHPEMFVNEKRTIKPKFVENNPLSSWLSDTNRGKGLRFDITDQIEIIDSMALDLDSHSHRLVNNRVETRTAKEMRISNHLMDDYQKIHKQSKLVIAFQNTPNLYTPLLELFLNIFNLKPNVLWIEALRVNYLSTINKKQQFYDGKTAMAVVEQLKEGIPTIKTLYIAASILIFDTWKILVPASRSPFEPYIGSIVSFATKSDFPPLKLAYRVREVANGNTDELSGLDDMLKSKDENVVKMLHDIHWKRGNLKSSKTKIISQ